MATTVASLQAVLDADTKRFNAKMAGADRTMNKTSSTGKKAFSALGRAARVGFLAAGAAVVGGAAYSVKAASDLSESINAVEVVFGKASKQIFAFGETAATSAGLSQRAFNQAVTPIGAALQNVGFNAQEAATEAINLTQRAADMASVFNVDVGEALQAIQAGLRGELDPLEKFGVSLNESALQAIAVKEGIAGANDELTAAQKVQARLAAIMDQTNKVQGDFVNTSDGLANQQRILRAQLENVAAEIGTHLIPLITKVVQFVNEKGIPAIERFGRWLSPRLTSAMETVGDFIKQLQDGWRQLNNTLDKHQSTVSKVVTVLGVLVAAVRLVVRWHIFLYGTIIKVELAFLRIALTITDKVVGAIQTLIGWVRRIAGAARAAAGPFITAFRIMLGPVLTIINAVQSLIDLINRIPTPSGSSAADLSGIPSPHTAPAGHRAFGGPVAAMRSYLVGERGPELLTMGARGGYITPRLGGDLHLHLAPNSVIAERDLHTLIRRLDEDHRRRNG